MYFLIYGLMIKYHLVFVCLSLCSRLCGLEGVALDGDDPEHIQWVYQRSLERAAEFNITGVTYRLTQGEHTSCVFCHQSTVSYVVYPLGDEPRHIKQRKPLLYDFGNVYCVLSWEIIYKKMLVQHVFLILTLFS